MADLESDSKPSKLGRFALGFLKGLGKCLAVLIVFSALLFTVVGLFIFATPSVKFSSDLTASLVERYAPANLKIGFKAFTLEINRPEGNFWAKQIVLSSEGLCVQYELPAVDVCTGTIRLAFTAGFGGQLEENQAIYIPHLIGIEPLTITAAVIKIDLTAFPPSKPDEKPSSFDLLGFVRKEILPRWDLEGSRVEVVDFKIRTSPDSSFAARFDLKRGEAAHQMDAVLHEARALEGPLKAEALLTVMRPADWGGAGDTKAWKVFANGDLTIDAQKSVRLKADANIVGLQNLDFRIQTFLKGIAVVRELRLEGKIDHDVFKGLASATGGAESGEIQILNFVNCALSADLAKKEGGIRCGPQAVKLQIRERDLIHRPDLFVFNPEVDLKISNLTFDEKKAADYQLDVILDHLGVARFGTRLNGHVEIKKAGVEYSVKGRADLVVPLFKPITEMLRRTTYAIPAPLNSLDGAIGLQANVDLSSNGGTIDYLASTRLDSDDQQMNLDVSGKTVLEKKAGGGLSPSTDMTLTILSLALSAPRFDLRAPPAFKPDGRFGPINEKAVKAQLEQIQTPKSGRFKLRVHTASNEAIRIATNLTKASIPITVDVTYDDHNGEKSPVEGSVVVGEVPIELFKRNALVRNIRVDLLGSGDNRLNGLVFINYGDYAINILLLGQVSDPIVRFFSDPPLDDDQIVSVLLFGRPQHELGEEQKSTVSNTKTAMADAVLGLGSLYLLASTPVESVGYDPVSGRVIARVGLGGGASIELGAGSQDAGQGVGFRKRLSKDFSFRSDVETIGSTGQRTVSALIEWVKRF